MKIAIIGGVAGGSGAAAAARRANEAAEIDLFEAGPYISFANCGLPYYLSGEIGFRDQLLVTSPEIMQQRLNINVHVSHRVLAIDRAGKTLRVRDNQTGAEFDHAYDRLVVATGARAIRPAIPGIDHPRVSECRTVTDVDHLTEMMNGHKRGRVLVLGGGFIGAEVTEALALRGFKVTLADLAPQILPPLDPEMAAVAQREMLKHGVSFRFGVKAEALQHGGQDSVAVLSNGERVPFDFAVLCIGVTPEVSLAEKAGLAIGATGGMVVDEHQRTSDPDIFAAGDVTESLYWPTRTRMRLALAGPANKQARVAGTNAALPAPQFTTPGSAGTNIVRVFEQTIAMTGLSEKAAVARKIPYKVVYTRNTQHASYFPGGEPLFIKMLFSPADGKVLGAQIFGKEGADKRIDVLSTAIQAGFTVDQVADLDLAYAPPYGSAKDPVIIAGMVASNVFHGRSRNITPRELAAELASGLPPLVVDVRTPEEHSAAKIDGSVNVPLETIRRDYNKVPRDRPVVVQCMVGYRAYLAERILRQLGYENVRNLTGGIHAWQLCQGPAPKTELVESAVATS
jgi:NADPH-dependent 2,4-dienoyl-CoA reductase/sulfur reductase-like enzyme/rhodanese-related sulfurtransferase